jgi:hypothetical protein
MSDEGGREGKEAARVNTALLVAIAVTTLCAAPWLGVPAIAYALGARVAQRAGNRELARKRTRISGVLSTLGILVGLLCELFFLIRYLGRGFQ